jgi:response regulator RpfG family c-di-GMP phosphodiesterase
MGTERSVFAINLPSGSITARPQMGAPLLMLTDKKLLENTVSGSIALMVDILSMVNPQAFERTTRVTQLVEMLCNRLDIENPAEIRIAAVLSQVGCVAVPDAILRKIQHGDHVTLREAQLYAAHPHCGHRFVSYVPCLNRVADIIARQRMPYGGEQSIRDEPDQPDIAMRAGFLRVALDYDALLHRGHSPPDALREMLARSKSYHPYILQALSEAILQRKPRVRDASIPELVSAMGVHQNESAEPPAR